MSRLYLQWHITERCGNDCRHCYAKGHRITDDTKQDDFLAILGDAISTAKRWNKQLHVVLIGGDPLFHPFFWRFYQMLAERVDRVGLAGNPETLTPTVIERFLLQCHSFQLSVDGIEETHDWFRYPGSYLLTIKKIKEASQMGLRIHVMTTVSESNLSQLPEIMKSVYEAGARHWEFSRYIPPVGQIQDLPDPMEYRSMMNKVHQLHQYYESNCGKKKLHKYPLWYPFANESPCLADNPDGCIWAAVAWVLLHWQFCLITRS